MKDNISYEKCCVLKCMNTWDTDVDSHSFFVFILREMLWLLSVMIQNRQVCSPYQGYRCGESIHQSRLLCIWRSFTATCIRSDYQANMVLKKPCHLEHLTSLYTFYVYDRYINWQCHKNIWSTETVKFKILSTARKTIQTQNRVKIVTYLLTYLFLYLLVYLRVFMYLLTSLLTYLLNYLLTYLLTYLLACLLTSYLLTYLLTHSLIHSLTHSLTHSLHGAESLLRS
jgi:hypothetical protein